MKSLVVIPFLSLLLFSGSQAPGPVMNIALEYEFGDMTLGEPETAIITFENQGNEPLRLSCTSPCKCITLKWPEKSVDPGKTDTLYVTFDAAKPGDMKKVVYVTTNEIDRYDGIGQPIFKRHTIQLTGYVNEP